MHKALFLKIFLRQEKKLDREVKDKITKAVKEIIGNPYGGIPLRGDLKSYWKKRVGKYRIIYKIDEKEKAVIFFDADLRKRIYDRMKKR